MSDSQNWKCKECGLVCGTKQGIRSHWIRKQEKGEGHREIYTDEKEFALPTSEPVTNPGWHKVRGKGKKNKKRKKVNIPQRKSQPTVSWQATTTSSDGPLVIYPLVIRGNEVVHPGSFGVFAEPQEINQKSLLEALVNDERV